MVDPHPLYIHPLSKHSFFLTLPLPNPSILQMKFRYGVDSSTLHVRCTNRGAQKLYVDSLGYKIVETVEKYYQDGADAYYMKLGFREDEEPITLGVDTATAAAAAGASPHLINEKENGALTQDSQGYFHLYRNTPAGSSSSAASSASASSSRRAA